MSAYCPFTQNSSDFWKGQQINSDNKHINGCLEKGDGEQEGANRGITNKHEKIWGNDGYDH